MYQIQEIGSWLRTQNEYADATAPIRFLCVDSRRIVLAAQTLFFALKTNRRDGHIFISELYATGVKNFIVQHGFDAALYPTANFIFVQNSLEALQTVASRHRKRFEYPVIGITGSNGKTIVKEWLYQLLSTDKKIIRSPRSYNSQIGVPLSVWQMDATADMAIFEAGISEPGEMEALEIIINPDIGIITNIGTAHDNFFQHKQHKAEEKMKLFANCKVVIAPLDDIVIATLLPNIKAKKFTWGYHKDADVQIESIQTDGRQSTLRLIIAKETIEFYIPFIDQASISNAICCITCLVYLQIPAAIIAERIQNLQPVEMRLQLMPAVNDCVLLNDSYSFDLASFTIALEFLEQQAGLPKTVILSDIPHAAADAYTHVLQLLHAKKVNRLITIGKEWANQSDNINIASHKHFEDSGNFFEHSSINDFKQEAILLKGARSFGFEKIAMYLQHKVHQTVLEINLTALIHNLNEYRRNLKTGTKIMAMVKASGYGSGSAEVALALQYHKADYLAVAYADEGAELRRAGIRLPIMVLNIDAAAFNTLIQYNLEPEIFSTSLYHAFNYFLDEQGLISYPVHIKIDTGMHRLGFPAHEIDGLCTALRSKNNMFIKSVFSHLASGEAAEDDDFTTQQANLFIRVCKNIEEAVGYGFIKHIANSAGAIRKPDLQFDMVRVGIGLYGVNTSGSEALQLHTVASLKTTIAQLHQLKAGDTVGYNRKGKINKDSIIATLRVGYADGYPRMLSNGIGQFYIRGLMAPVVGTIAMDMLMVDVSHIAEVQEGDEAEAFGHHIPIQQVATQSNTIAYEILTGIGQRVKRVYVEE
mgnify:CR=1 FL=1